MLASGDFYGNIILWNADNGEETELLKGHTGGVWSVCFSPSSKTLASASTDNSVRIWNLESGK